MTVTLPASAKLKLFHLQSLAGDAKAQASATMQRISHAEEALGYAENTDTDVANLEVELSRLRAAMAQLNNKGIQRSQLVAQVNTWTSQLQPQWTITAVPRTDPTLMPGESHLTAVQRLRMEIASLSKEVRGLTLAVMEKEEQKTRAEQYVRQLARSVNASISAHHMTGFKVSMSVEASAEERPQALIYAAWLNPEAMTERLHEIIDAAPSRTAMSARDREKRLASVSAKLLQAERSEEAHIEAAAEGGLEIERRPTADPCAVLGLRISKRAMVMTR